MTPTKSLFFNGVSLDELVKLAEVVAPDKQKTGPNYQRIVGTHEPIGWTAGHLTAVFTVITRPDGSLVTMFPGQPRR